MLQLVYCWPASVPVCNLCVMLQDQAGGNGAARLPEHALKSDADADYSSADLDKRLHSEIPDAERASLADILESRYLLGLEPSTFS